MVAGLLALAGLISVVVAVTNRPHRVEPPLSATSPSASEPSASSVPPSAEPAPAPTVVGPVLQASAPVTLTIPAIDVRSRLLRLGQTPEGELEVPAPGPQYDRAGWYRYSPTPGSLGPAVIVGHVDSAENGASVFARLGSLHKGDRIRVARADGSVAVFAIDDVRLFRKARFPSRLVYGNTDHAALRLITCGGPLDPNGHYRDNVVVLASLVEPAA